MCAQYHISICLASHNEDGPTDASPGNARLVFPKHRLLMPLLINLGRLFAVHQIKVKLCSMTFKMQDSPSPSNRPTSLITPLPSCPSAVRHNWGAMDRTLLGERWSRHSCETGSAVERVARHGRSWQCAPGTRQRNAPRPGWLGHGQGYLQK